MEAPSLTNKIWEAIPVVTPIWNSYIMTTADANNDGANWRYFWREKLWQICCSYILRIYSIELCEWNTRCYIQKNGCSQCVSESGIVAQEYAVCEAVGTRKEASINFSREEATQLKNAHITILSMKTERIGYESEEHATTINSRT